MAFLTVILLLSFTESKSILTDGDWKKLWIEAGSANANQDKKDNTIDSGDSPSFEDTEVRAVFISYMFPNVTCSLLAIKKMADYNLVHLWSYWPFQSQNLDKL